MQLAAFLLPAALLLGACATDNSPTAVCRRQAEQDPKVKALEFSSAHSMALAETDAGELAFLRREDTLRCLQDKGVISEGGVEPVRPPMP